MNRMRKIPEEVRKKLNDKTWLEEQYLKREKSATLIAKELGVGHKTIYTALKNHNIARRERSEAFANNKEGIKLLKDEHWLNEEYIQKRKSTNQIAKEIGVSKRTVCVYVKKHNITPREDIEYRISNPKTLKSLSDPKWLRENYLAQQKTTSDMANELGVSPHTIISRLKQFGIPIKDNSESHLKNPDVHEKLQDAKWLEQEYVKSRKTLQQIGKENGVSLRPIKKALLTKGFEIRTQSEQIIQNPDALDALNNKDWLAGEYLSKTSSTIAKELGVTQTTVLDRLAYFEIIDKKDTSSDGERKIRDFLGSYTEVLANERLVIAPKELDIYCPRENIAIEYNGTYWHSEKYKPMNYHLDKYIACKEKGIQLFQIWDTDYESDPNKIKQLLLVKLGKAVRPTMYARKTELDLNVPKSEADKLLKSNHIQGPGPASLRYGLRGPLGALVAVCAFKKHPEGFELTRYCTNHNVPGGFTKLVRAFQRTYPGVNLISFADHMISNGGLYENNGWEIDKTIPPDYKYLVKAQTGYKYELAHKFNYRKTRFKSDPNLLWNPESTEHELAKLNGLLRVYDAGKTRYVLKS